MAASSLHIDTCYTVYVCARDGEHTICIHIHSQSEVHEQARAGIRVLVSASPISVYHRVLMGHIKAVGSIK